MKLILPFLIIFSQNVFALSAHVHGLASLDVATDKKQVLIMFKSPGFSVFGFGHAPKTQKDKMTFSKIKKSWTQNEGIFGLKGSSCKIKSSDLSVEFTGKNHSEVNAEVTLNCDKEVKGIELEIKLIKAWIGIKEIHFQLLREDGSVVSKKTKKDFNIKL